MAEEVRAQYEDAREPGDGGEEAAQSLHFTLTPHSATVRANAPSASSPIG